MESATESAPRSSTSIPFSFSPASSLHGFPCGKRQYVIQYPGRKREASVHNIMRGAFIHI